MTELKAHGWMNLNEVKAIICARTIEDSLVQECPDCVPYPPSFKKRLQIIRAAVRANREEMFKLAA